MALIRVFYIEDQSAQRFQLPGAGAATAVQVRALGGYRQVTEFTSLSTGVDAARLVENIVSGTSESEVQARNHLLPGVSRGLIPGDLVEIESDSAWVWLRSGWQRLP